MEWKLSGLITPGPRRRTALVLAPLVAAALITLIWIAPALQGGRRIKPRTGPIVEAVYALGTVKSDSVWNLKGGVAAAVGRLYVSEGQAVKRGEALLTTDSGVIFRAPFSGTVTRLYCEEGEIIITGAPLLTLMDLSKTFVQVSLDQQSALRVRKNQSAQLSVETIRGKRLSGIVERIYPSGGQFIARIRVSEMPQEVLPEMTADVAIEGARRERAGLVPLAAIKEGMLTIRRNGKRMQLPVSIGAVDGAWGEALGGAVHPGDEIVIGR